MVKNPTPSPTLQKMREWEERIAQSPSVKGYLKLADGYNTLGLFKETERVLQLAEKCEAALIKESLKKSGCLFSGAVNPTMLVEILQILSRTHKSGELILEAPDQTFRVYFQNGEIIHARSTNFEEGLPSFYMAIRIIEGSYRFIEKNDLSIQPLIEIKTNHLIMEAVRRMDEDRLAPDR